ncbi:hypothetical protein N7478_011265 [Penicillium angulare]|uniref:uncharacterized protein n=1 Tax=Penicillium angulare TaxID=116970 RepID=UPI0025400F6C|nr:uncharacterized protein N7478_011265 [Penicillium angulare]KAJ5263660.1 hypothetical protein N7478_011265 [Penicillium angulare]
MLVFVGKLNYSPYAADELITVVFRDNVQVGDKVAVILQWSQDASGQAKANASAHGTVGKLSAVSSPLNKKFELFSDEKESTYYWYKGELSGTKLNLAMWNKKGEEVAKNIELQLIFA